MPKDFMRFYQLFWMASSSSHKWYKIINGQSNLEENPSKHSVITALIDGLALLGRHSSDRNHIQFIHGTYTWELTNTIIFKFRTKLDTNTALYKNSRWLDNW